MPDYKQAVKPVLWLLSGESNGVWKKEQTAALNHIVDLVFFKAKAGACGHALWGASSSKCKQLGLQCCDGAAGAGWGHMCGGHDGQVID